MNNNKIYKYTAQLKYILYINNESFKLNFKYYML